MTDPTATMFQNMDHPMISIRLYMIGTSAYPSAAVAYPVTGPLGQEDRRDWFGVICKDWPAEPGYCWQRGDERHAIVKRL